ncbi:MAG: PKD domain-containing protein [Dehalococcoidia bacterium]|nr:PKD domain-containing protein [Dehalococcoidia bacterium]
MRQYRLNMLSMRNWVRLVFLLVTVTLLLSSACASSSPPPPPPPPPNQLPVIESITAENEIPTLAQTQITAAASDADGDSLTYQWSANGGTITWEGNTIAWMSPGNSDNYTINLTVSDGKGGTTAQSITITVIDKPNHPPVIAGLTIDGAPPIAENIARQWVTKTIQCNANDPDSDKLSYMWRTTGGKITGEGSTVGWTSPGVNGEYTLTVVVSDGRGGKAEGSVVFKVLCCGRG